MAERNLQLVRRLSQAQDLADDEWLELFSTWDDGDRAAAAQLAAGVSRGHFGNRIFVRGIVEFSNHCRNDCLYCGLRASNRACARYRLEPDQMLACCQAGYDYGFRTFVFQSGEDPQFPVSRLAQTVRMVKGRFPDCAVTLSVGELSRDDYAALREAGADRYLLRHESASEEHYASLHPSSQQWGRRMQCLRWLKELGFQTGCGFMVGSPGQQPSHLVQEMRFLHDFRPAMIGIGPFIPHQGTPLAKCPAGSAELTLFLLSLLRLQHPEVLLPATTALATLRPDGREAGVLAGANVIMPNLSPESAARRYVLYDNMKSDPARSSVMESELQRRMEAIGYTLSVGRGDYPPSVASGLAAGEESR